MPELDDKLKDKLKLRRTSKQADMSQILYGKVQPQAPELEEAVLGALMLEKNAVGEVLSLLSPDTFYKPEHQEVYRAINQLFVEQKPIDMLTVTDKLRSNGKLDEIGGAYFIATLTEKVASSAHIEYHARIIVQKYIQRELIKVSADVIKQSYEETSDVFDILDQAESNLYNITSKNLKRDFESMDKLLVKALTNLETLSQHEDGLSLGSVPSGFTELDRITSGFQKSDLIIAAARPGMGKTALALSFTRHAAITHAKSIAIFSLEMSNLQLVNRLISAETELNSSKLRKGDLAPYEWQQLHSRITKLSNAKIFIDDTAGIDIFELRAKCRRLKQQHQIDMVIIDYLQLMHASKDGTNKTGNREQEISTISRNLKGLAKELDIPVIALAQLSRAVEVRGGLKKPQLSDLRESGSIEQDADIVMFLWRPEKVGQEVDANGNSLKGIAYLLLEKHRNGSTGEIVVKFEEKFSRFVDLDPVVDQTEFNMNISAKEKNYDIKPSKMKDIGDNPNYDPPW